MLSRVVLWVALSSCVLTGCIFGFDTDYPAPDSAPGDTGDLAEAGDASDLPDTSEDTADADADSGPSDADADDIDGTEPDVANDLPDAGDLSEIGDAPDGTAPDADADADGDADPPDVVDSPNACGGGGALRWDGADALPGEPCGEFGEGALVCDGVERLRCQGEAATNACGGTSALTAEPGAACGCGGVWACDGVGGLVCAGALPPNGCGGCPVLDGEPGVPCHQGPTAGIYACDGRDRVACVVGQNACGGTAALVDETGGVTDGLPGDPCEVGCGDGSWTCDGPDALRCEAPGARNGCGGCAALPGNPGDRCGPLHDGEWVCSGVEAVECVGASEANACGGAAVLDAAPGEVCGASMRWVCARGELVCVADTGGTGNACGGAGGLEGEPGAACGSCGAGEWTCDDPDAVVCSVPEAGQPNACGGCGVLDGAPGLPCGTCGDGAWVCEEPDGDAVMCEDDVAVANACGSCGDLGGEPGAACGQCGTLACVSGRLRCTEPPDGCAAPVTCAALACGDEGRVCIEASGAVDARCGGCDVGWVDLGGVCVREGAVVMGVEASDGESDEHVMVRWSAFSGATGYHVYRDGARITTAAFSGTEFADTGAGRAPAPQAPVVSASTDGDEVFVEWTEAAVSAGPPHTYTVIAVVGTAATSPSAPDDGYRAAWPVVGYELSIDGGAFVPVGLERSYLDTSAPAPSVAAGTVNASDASTVDGVEIEVVGAGVQPGEARLFVVRAFGGAGAGDESVPALGQRAWLGDAATLQWQRSADEDDADYADVPGRTSATWLDMDAPLNGEVRYYRVVVAAPPLAPATSLGDPGRRLELGAPPPPSVLTASLERYEDHVGLSWSLVAAVKGYRVYRDGVFIAEISSVSNYDDYGAAAPGVCPSVPGVTATVDDADAVRLEWTPPDCRPPSHTYYVTSVGFTDAESPPSMIAVGRRSALPIEEYEVEVNFERWVSAGDGTSYRDAEAPRASFEPGSTLATDGEYLDRVELSLLGTESTPGEYQSYRVRALNAAGQGIPSNEVQGRRAFAGILNYAWQRSSGTTSDDYSDLVGASTSTWQDLDAPTDGSVRWYRARINLNDGTSELSAPDSGFRRPAPPAAPAGVVASDGLFADRVRVTWAAVDGADGYEVYRGGLLLTPTPIADTTFADTGAASPSYPAPSGLSASSDRTSDVAVAWTPAVSTPGTTHTYTVYALGAGGRSGSSAAETGFRDAGAAISYQLQADGGAWINVGSATSVQDTTAPAATIAAASANASFRLDADAVELALIGGAIQLPPVRQYSVRALWTDRTGPAAAPVGGRRSAGPMQYQWLRSAADSDADYSPLDGATASSHADRGAPADGSARWYRVALAATGAGSLTSSGDRGARAFPIGSARLGEPCSLPGAACVEGAWCPTNTTEARCAPWTVLPGDVDMQFQYVPAGRFDMGSPEDELIRDGNETQHTVLLTRDFAVGRTELTQGQWKAVTGGVNPSCFQAASGTSCSASNTNDSGPIEQIDWFAALAYANELSRREGLPACYELTPVACADTIADWSDGDTSCLSASVSNAGCPGYRLLSEAEWEYAVRAETDTATYAGELTAVDCSDTTLLGIAWFCGNSAGRSRSVGGRAPNTWGLYDMLGNVWEWTADTYGTYPGATVDPPGALEGDDRVLRGGSWYGEAGLARAAMRVFFAPDSQLTWNGGMRLARSMPVARGSLPLGAACGDDDECNSGHCSQSAVYPALDRCTDEGFVYVPPGEFEMGSPLAEPGRSADEGTRRVQLTRAFEIGATEVTVAQWRAVMGLGGDPSETAGCGTSCPANGMRWDSALSYANALSAREGLPPCYELTGCTGSILTGTLACTGANVIGGATVYDCIGYRLPTEAEWEYATRAGTSTAFWSGANTNPRDDCAPVAALSTAGWSCADGGEGAETVGTRSANAWGLHDVHGNVWEFVWDGYALYGSGAAVDPVRNTGSSRVARGGGWSSVPRDCRSATRVARAMAFANSSHGFRVVRTIHLRSD